MSGRRWIVLLGPPLLVAATLPGLAVGTALNPGAMPSPQPGSIAACSAGPSPAERGDAGAVPGTWWRTEPALDAAGTLESWALLVGAPGTPTGELSIPVASTVTGPVAGRVVVTSEGTADEGGSTVRIVDVVGGCADEIRVVDRIARRAVADPGGNGLLVHLLEPDTRRDLGVWRIALDGRIEGRVLEPVPDATLAAAGMDRVWATDLRLDPAGRRLAVQSCHPDACLTRIVDLARGDAIVLARGSQGPIVGFSGRQLVTWAACHGLPCPVVGWDLAGRSDRILSAGATGAALSGDGQQLVVERPGATGAREFAAIDLRSGSIRGLGAGGVDVLPLSGGAGMDAGLEVLGNSVAIGRAGRVPTLLDLGNAAASFALPEREVQP